MSQSSNRKVYAIAAMDQGRAIGFRGKLPWDAPDDLKRFSRLTKGHTVLMGRKTWDSLPEAFKPLPGRLNVVVTRTPEQFADSASATPVSSAQDYIRAFRAGKAGQGEHLWVIGGAQLYQLTSPLWDGIYLTVLSGNYPGDAWMPVFENEFDEPELEAHDGFNYMTYLRRK
jgi:dihydrofolate reductase